MAQIEVYDGTTDVHVWAFKVKAKLTSKGFKSQLLDVNCPGPAEAGHAAWVAQADKAHGGVLNYLATHVAEQFEDRQTPQALLDAVVARYRRNNEQEVERLEGELLGLTYDNLDPIAWCAGVRGLVSKLTSKYAPPTDWTVRMLVLNVLKDSFAT